MSTEAVDSPVLDRHECAACGYIYEPVRGDSTNQVPAGTPFEDLADTWRCPVCGARKNRFSNIGPAGSPSGFKENLGYGIGFNAMPPGQKNLVIFGALAIAFLLFMSLYGLR